MAAVPKFNEASLQALADILGDTSTGLIGSEIGRYLRECSFPDPIPQMTKRHRLYAALAEKQTADGCANNVLGFIVHVMNPVRHAGGRDYFESERGKLDSVLAFSGLSLGEDGKLHAVTAAQTLTEAEATASALRKVLIERKVHAACSEILSGGIACRQLFSCSVRSDKKCCREAAPKNRSRFRRLAACRRGARVRQREMSTTRI